MKRVMAALACVFVAATTAPVMAAPTGASDACETAKPLALGVRAEGDFSSAADVDWYEFRLPARRLVRLLLGTETEPVAGFRLYRACTDWPVSGWIKPKEYGHAELWRWLDAGVYRVKVRPVWRVGRGTTDMDPAHFLSVTAPPRGVSVVAWRRSGMYVLTPPLTGHPAGFRWQWDPPSETIVAGEIINNTSSPRHVAVTAAFLRAGEVIKEATTPTFLPVVLPGERDGFVLPLPADDVDEVQLRTTSAVSDRAAVAIPAAAPDAWYRNHPVHPEQVGTLYVPDEQALSRATVAIYLYDGTGTLIGGGSAAMCHVERAAPDADLGTRQHAHRFSRGDAEAEKGCDVPGFEDQVIEGPAWADYRAKGPYLRGRNRRVAAVGLVATADEVRSGRSTFSPRAAAPRPPNASEPQGRAGTQASKQRDAAAAAATSPIALVVVPLVATGVMLAGGALRASRRRRSVPRS